jgi:hypothetical protein
MKSYGTIVGIIDRTELKKLLKLHIAHPSGFAYIQVSDGRLLAAVGGESVEAIPAEYFEEPHKGTFSLNVDDKQFVVSYLRSASKEWLYVAGISVFTL